ncbi:MAG: carboxypeptidase regulatory-like domain-containing protein [Bacteroidales bacterium]|nr:carboxypeptidase regulatory-like domain-containing protein [Bacteroidales bacterium]
MKKILAFLLIVITLFTLSSCNTGEGTGGRGTIEGNVYLVLHPDDNYNLDKDTVLAAKEDVFIVYGNESFYGDDVETDHTGHYVFNYLRPGNYTVYAYSSLPSGERVAEYQTVTLGKGEHLTAPDIYIHDGKAYGTSIIKGQVYATYIDKDGNVLTTGPAYNHRMYLQRMGEAFPCDDVRAGLDGIFMFQKVTPGDYIVFTTSIYNEDEVPLIVQKTVSVPEPDAIVEIPDRFEITIKP